MHRVRAQGGGELGPCPAPSSAPRLSWHRGGVAAGSPGMVGMVGMVFASPGGEMGWVQLSTTFLLLLLLLIALGTRSPGRGSGTTGPQRGAVPRGRGMLSKPARGSLLRPRARAEGCGAGLHLTPHLPVPGTRWSQLGKAAPGLAGVGSTPCQGREGGQEGSGWGLGGKGLSRLPTDQGLWSLACLDTATHT